MILPPNWTARNENPATRGTGIVTIYKGDIPWQQFTVPIHDPEPERKKFPGLKTIAKDKRRYGSRSATTAEKIIGEALDDLAEEILGVKIRRSKKRR